MPTTLALLLGCLLGDPSASSPSIWERLELYANGRLRWESTFEQPNGEDRHRGRLRFRVGGSYAVLDDVTVHARLSTSSDGVDANNPYWDFGDGGDGFEGGEVVLDRFWAGWRAGDWVELRAGKLPHAFVKPPVLGELHWDDDVQPAGFAAVLSCPESAESFDLRLVKYTAVESGGDDDPSMLGAQANFRCPDVAGLELSASSSVSHWSNLGPGAGSLQNQGNTTAGGGVLASDFTVWETFVAVTHPGGPLGRTQAFAQYWDNLAESSQRGYAVGGSLGELDEKGDLRVFGGWFEMDEDSLFSPVAQDDTPIPGTGSGTGMEGMAYGGEVRVGRDATVRLWALASHSETSDNPYRVRLDFNFVVRP